jgi:5'-nucleotidase
MIIGLDVDDVCASLIPKVLEIYNKSYDDNLTENQITQWDISKFVKPKCGKKIFKYFEKPKIYDDIVPVTFALDGITMLRKQGARIVYVTAALPGTMDCKFKWLKKWGFIENREDYIVAKDKKLISGIDMLIDDNYDNIASFPGYGVLYAKPWNMSFDYKPRINDWNDLIEKIRSIL